MASHKIAIWGALLLGCLGSVIFYLQVTPSYPVQDWLFWTYASIWAWQALFTLSCLSFGQFLILRVLRLRRLPVLESAVLSMATGSVSFVLGMYLGGALRIYNAGFAVLLPVSLLTVGGRDGWHLITQAWVELERARHSTWSAAVTVAGIVCLGLVYFSLMSPDSINYDAVWYHLTIAQDYARWGGIRPFLGNYNSCVPHLASILYTWTLLVPGLSRVEHWMCAQHIEFVMFLWTLAGVAAAIQRMVENWSLRASWVAFFLFPSIFVYDNNLGTAADHVLAFYSVPILLATLHVCRSFSRGNCALLALVLAGATLTKYQAVYLIVPVVVIVSTAWTWASLRVALDQSGLAARVSRRDLRWAPVILIGLGSLCVAPHFLKNYIFFKNPVYPFLLDVFTKTTPTVADAKFAADRILTDPDWIPRGSLATKLKHAIEIFFTFSFKAHYSTNKGVPYFGSLFTLLLPGLLFVRARLTTVIAVVIATLALLIWGVTYNIDRNLQAFMPLMVCVTATIMIQLWRLGWQARLGLIPLVALQVIWGGDAPFYSGNTRIAASLNLLSTGFEGHAKSRFDVYQKSHVQIDKVLPKDATILLHDLHLTLGMNRDTLLDREGIQGRITYRTSHTPRELYDYFRSFGITHILDYPDAVPNFSRQAQILYYTFVNRYAVKMETPGDGYRLMAMPNAAPPAEPPYRVLCFHLHGYDDGLYPIDKLYKLESIPVYLQNYSKPERPLNGSNAMELLKDASAVMIGEPTDIGNVRGELGNTFEQIAKLGDVVLHVRKR